MSLIQSNQFFEMQSALDHYDEHRTTLKMTTGSADLDSLIDAIQGSAFGILAAITISPIAIATPAMAQNATGGNATSGNATAANATAGYWTK